MADAKDNTQEVKPEEAVVTPTEQVAPEVEVPAPVVETEAPVEAEAPEFVPLTRGTSANKDGTKKLVRLVAELLLVAAVIGLSVWGYGLMQKNQDLQKEVDTLNANPAIVEQKKTAELVTKVGALVELPKDETPQAALVSDADALKKQYAFFKDVEKDDQVLFYVQAGKVFVYRPSINKIVVSGPLTISQGATQGTTKQD